MLGSIVMLALHEPFENGVPPEKPSVIFGLTLQDMLLILGAAAVLALILFLSVYLTRKGRRGDSLARSPKAIYAPEPAYSGHSDRRARFRKKRRRNHAEPLPRNPTLGETGGLPPVREDPPAPL
jgi:hypothetical protein